MRFSVEFLTNAGTISPTDAQSIAAIPTDGGGKSGLRGTAHRLIYRAEQSDD